MSPELAPVALFERVRDPEITTLEIGDLLLDGDTLRSRLRAGHFASALPLAIETMRAGLGASRAQGPLPASVAGFEAVMIAGGRAGDIQAMALNGLSCALFFGQGGVFAGERGGFELLQARGLHGWVLDLGQSNLKLSTPSRRWAFQRDLGRLHVPGRNDPVTLSTLRRRLREFLALKLQSAMVETNSRPGGLVFALPTRLGDDGVPGRSSYDGMEGDGTLLRDVLEISGLTGVPLLVLNDAELAAHSARLDSRLAKFRKVLVITLGFGIGAALINRSP